MTAYKAKRSPPELSYHRHHQNCTIQYDYIISGRGGKALEDNQPRELSGEGEVSLLDGFLRLCYPVGTLSINRQVQGHPSPCGFSQRCLMQELAIFYNLPPIVKHGSERGLVDINIVPI